LHGCRRGRAAGIATSQLQQLFMRRSLVCRCGVSCCMSAATQTGALSSYVSDPPRPLSVIARGLPGVLHVVRHTPHKHTAIFLSAFLVALQSLWRLVLRSSSKYRTFARAFLQSTVDFFLLIETPKTRSNHSTIRAGK